MKQLSEPSSAVIHRALLIDDDDMDNFLHQRVIEKSTLVEQVVVFENAEEALTYVCDKMNLIDIIFVDLNMPRMDGFAFLDAFQELEYGPETPPIVVLLSTSISPEDADRVSKYSTKVLTEKKPLCLKMLKRLLADRINPPESDDAAS
ncbi:response regulator [Planctomycetes bacterium K23_9]|uniref:Hybrid sensory histidine kinase BarA n=1 Tax=Stieleria marina TaxID=1930275 RepID=A0A517NW79_9BACT|nr:hybrid sensory histidine kinase BarA [Planctomycetes bacterium K23_9]